jgi:hypothetical protein
VRMAVGLERGRRQDLHREVVTVDIVDGPTVTLAFEVAMRLYVMRRWRWLSAAEKGLCTTEVCDDSNGPPALFTNCYCFD